MQVIDPKVKILKQLDTSFLLDSSSSQEDINNMQSELFNNIINHIEACNTFCYNNDLKESIKKGINLDILEHGTVYLTVPIANPDPKYKEDYMRRMQIVNFYQNNSESIVKGYKSEQDGVLYVYFITTNYRVIIENNRHTDLVFLFNSSEYHVKRNTYAIITNKYTANKFYKIKYLNTSISNPAIENDEFSIISHSFDENSIAKNAWINSCKESYKIYEALIDSGMSKESAYKILPDTVKVNMVITAFDDDFEALFKTLDSEDDIDYCDVVHMIAYDHDNTKISEEIADEMAEENSEESGKIGTAEEIGGDTELPK